MSFKIGLSNRGLRSHFRVAPTLITIACASYPKDSAIDVLWSNERDKCACGHITSSQSSCSLALLLDCLLVGGSVGTDSFCLLACLLAFLHVFMHVRGQERAAIDPP